MLYLGTQYVMTTIDGGLHWETISPDLTGAIGSAGSDAHGAHETEGKKPPSTPTIEEAKRSGFGVVFTIAPSPLNRDLIWAGSDTGLIHLTRDGGKNWKDVSPPGLSDWSKISLIEASHFDPAVAYAAVSYTHLDVYKRQVVSRTDHDQITQRDWFPAGESESGYMVVDPNDPNIIYLSGTYGTVARFNKRTGLSQDISPWPAMRFDAPINQRKYRDPWTLSLIHIYRGSGESIPYRFLPRLDRG